VLAPTTFVEHIINASEWTRVRSRGRRGTVAIVDDQPRKIQSKRFFDLDQEKLCQAQRWPV
jgi:hypothetical protein